MTLQSIYNRIYGTEELHLSYLDNLAERLSIIADRDKPWTGKFLYSLLRGYKGFSQSDDFKAALKILSRQVDSIAELEAQIKDKRVRALYDLPEGTVVLGAPRQCSLHECNVTFVPTHPQQRYHTKRCARRAKYLRNEKGELT